MNYRRRRRWPLVVVATPAPAENRAERADGQFRESADPRARPPTLPTFRHVSRIILRVRLVFGMCVCGGGV